MAAGYALQGTHLGLVTAGYALQGTHLGLVTAGYAPRFGDCRVRTGSLVAAGYALPGTHPGLVTAGYAPGDRSPARGWRKDLRARGHPVGGG